LRISEGELAERRKAWRAPASDVLRGVLGKYRRLVGSAAEGAVTD
jgi:dihydroxy-acid dehydratase